ncbi:MAG: MFS transporter [Bdellovibrionales bacterium]|nr:MFS transporter [Bdellovibrionales bacterium]
MNPSVTRWVFVFFSYGCLFALGFLDNTRGPAFPSILRELGLSDSRGAWMFSSASITGFISAYACRWLLPRWGSLRILRLGLTLLMLGAAGVGTAHSFTWLIAGASCLGIGFGITGVAEHTLIQEHSPESQWRRLFSGLHSTYGFASLLAPLAYQWLASFGWSWDQIFLLFAAIPLSVLLAGVGLSGGLVRGALETGAKSSAPSREGQNDFKWQQLWVSLFVAGYLVGELSLGTRLVLYLQREQGLSAELAARALAGFFLLLFVSRFLLFLRPVTRWSSRSILLFCVSSSMVSYALGLWGWHWGFVLSGALMGPVFPVTVELIASQFGRESGSVLSLAMSVGTLAIVLMHNSLGLLSDQFGLQTALWLGPGCLAVAWLLLAVAMRPRDALLNARHQKA